MKRKQREFKVGDKVRVSRKATDVCAETAFGIVGEIVDYARNAYKVTAISKFGRNAVPVLWHLNPEHLKYAKQANKRN